MSTAVAFPTKKAFLYSLIGSVALSALLGIVAVLSGRFGWLEVRVILTTVTIAVASICGLACGAYWGTSAGRALPLLGIALTFLGAAMLILGVWTDVDTEVYWKVAAAICVFAVACAHLSLLSMARLAEWFQWSLVAAYLIIFGVASLIAVMIFFEINEQGMFRLLAVSAIVDATFTVLIPIFHRLSRNDISSPKNEATNVAQIDAEIARLRRRIAELEALKKS